MTEIPEHLLKRSQERRAAASGEPAAGGAPAAATPATVAPAAAAKAAAPAKAAPVLPPPPKPDPVYVAAAKNRKKIPFWAMATLSLLPIWGFMYVQGLKPQAKALSGPLGEGDQIYKTCSACHGPAGGGGSGRQLNEGEVLKTFPHIEDQLNFVYNGTQKYQLAGFKEYGDPTRAGGVHILGSTGGAMPPQSEKAGGSFTEAEILAVVCHERYSLAGGADPTSAQWQDEFELWCAAEAPIFLALEDGTATFDNVDQKFAAQSVLPVGTAPRPGKPADK